MNLQHLHYFWAVVRHGGVTRAAERLRLRPHSISAQLKQLQASLGQELLRKSGRNLVLTEAGERAWRYADEIFRLQEALEQDLAGRGSGRRRLIVGVSESFPKLLTRRLLQPALDQEALVMVEEDSTEQLLSRLALQELDLILADAPAPPTVKVRAYNHRLGESGVVVMAERAMAQRLKRGFPASLEAEPAYLPAQGSALRRSLDEFIHAEGLRLSPRGEFSDSALLKIFAAEGDGWTLVTQAAAADAERRYGIKVAGTLKGVTETFYAVTVERKVSQPELLAIVEAGQALFRH